MSTSVILRVNVWSQYMKTEQTTNSMVCTLNHYRLQNTYVLGCAEVAAAYSNSVSTGIAPDQPRKNCYRSEDSHPSQRRGFECRAVNRRPFARTLLISLIGRRIPSPVGVIAFVHMSMVR